MKKMYEIINDYTNANPARFHMPGHKGSLCTADITELSFSDNLHNPKGIIKELQERCARVYGANEAFLLVNGSSVGMCAFFVALELKLKRKPRVLVSRDCHRSMLSGAFLSDAVVCGVYPEFEPCGVVTPKIIKNALLNLREKPDAIVITSPNYYGMCANTAEIKKIANQQGILLFVDSAHGGAFPFSDGLPTLSGDVFVVSTHKTLEAVNQSGILLCNCDLSNELQSALNMLQTTSPSYPIMLSIENAMDNGCKYEKHIERIIAFREKLLEAGIKLIGKPQSVTDKDVTRLCISSEGIAVDGYSLAKQLENDNIFVEMADIYCVVCITTPSDNDEWYERLLNSLIAIKQGFNGTSAHFQPTEAKPDYRYVSIKQALLTENELIPLMEASNRIAAEPIGVYPPGTAFVFPNEPITDCVIDALLDNESRGGSLFGVNEGMIRVLI